MYNFQNYLTDSGILESLARHDQVLRDDLRRGILHTAALRKMYQTYQKARYMLYTPTPKQMEFHLAPQEVRSILAGNKFGKSLAAGMEICWALTGNYPDWYPESLRIPQPAKVHLVVSDFKEIGGDVWIPLMREWFPEYDNPRLWETSMRKQVVTTYWRYLPTGSELFMLSDEMAVKAFEGWLSNLIVVDEPFEEAKYAAMHARLIARRGRFVFVATPRKLCGWTKREFWDKSQLGETPDGNTYCLKADMDDNPYMTPEEIEKYMSRIPEDERACRRHGDFYSMSLLVFEKIAGAINTIMIPNRDVDPDWTQYIALDPHPNAPWAALYYMMGPEGLPVVFDEVWEKNILLDAFAKLLIDREQLSIHGAQPPDIKIIDHWCGKPDNKTGKSYIDMFDDAGYPGFRCYQKYNGSVDQHRELCRNRAGIIETDILPDSWFVREGILKPGRYRGPGILIMERCREFKYALCNLTFEDRKRRGADKSHREEEALGHLPDAWKMIEADRPYYVNRGRRVRRFKVTGRPSESTRRHPCRVK